MPGMNTSQARQVDAVLTKFAVGYTNADFISHVILPRVVVPSRGAKIIKFDKASFRKANTRRAPGAKRERIQFGYDAGPVSVHQHALDAVVPIEVSQEATKGPGINMSTTSVENVLAMLSLTREIEAAELLLDEAKYAANNKETLSGTSLWSEAGSNPEADIKEAKSQIRKRIGRDPNLLTLSPSAFEALNCHPKIKEQFKYTSSESVTEEMLAKYFQLEKVVVGKAVYIPDDAPDDADAQDVWGNDAILSYSPMNNQNYLRPAFGYTYELDKGTFVRKGHFDESCDSWIHPLNMEEAPQLTCADAGFIFKNPAGIGL